MAIPINDDATCLFEGGSRARGWHNDKSDYDLYLLVEDIDSIDIPHTDRLPIGSAPGYVLRGEIAESVDIQVWSISQVRDSIDWLTRRSFFTRTAPLDPFSKLQVEMLSRLRFANPIIGTELLNDLVYLLGQSRFNELVSLHYFTDADNALRDCVGQLYAGDTHSAMLSARRAVGFSVDAWLASLGEVSTSGKWRARRMRTALPEHFDEYWNFEMMIGYESPTFWLRRCIYYCQDISAKVNFELDPIRDREVYDE
ncbi:MAG: hypothetical protein ACRDDJ_00335 [[Mycobacterium] stephanolepidis]